MKLSFPQLLKVFNKPRKMKNTNVPLIGTALFLAFNIEKTQSEGEDADPILVVSSISDRFFIAVADGMGGSGSTNYEYDGEIKTGAYFASRITLEFCKEFFTELFDGKLPIVDKIQILENNLKERLNKYLNSFKFEKSNLKSKLIRALPTTLASIYVDRSADLIKIASIWAGDSRAYIMRVNEGLQQLSIDDLKEDLDPFENIQKDSQLKNFISADNKFRLNFKEIQVSGQFLAIVATDGCFGYFSTPMQFEYVLLKSLEDSDNMDDWRIRLEEKIKEVAGDDFSMMILILGWENDFIAMKNDIMQRKKILYETCITGLEGYDIILNKLKDEKNKIENDIKKAEIQKQTIQKIIWEEYKKKYYKIQNNIQ